MVWVWSRSPGGGHRCTGDVPWRAKYRSLGGSAYASVLVTVGDGRGCCGQLPLADVSHDDQLRRLAGKFHPQDRYANFGPLLQTMEIHGFRGIRSLTLPFQSSISAMSGLNGTGKSTIAQLATCAYRKASTAAAHRYYVADFFPVSTADPEPFTPDAKVIYTYAVQRGADPQQVTVSRKVKEWSGYKRQPERTCYYIGFTQFLPKVERRDFSVYRGHLLELGVSRALSGTAAAQISRILALPYDALDFTEVSHGTKVGELAMATRNGRRYSENHMGFGEGRVVYMVNTMETAPVQSLFVLEEPETSLHGDAQVRLAQYLAEVSFRRGHQIILTTHSPAILGQLARESVVYVRRGPDGSLSATTGLSTYQVDSYLQAEGRSNGKATICVEDDFARRFAIEIMRRCDPDLLAGCSLLPIGGGQELAAAVRLLRDAGVRAVGLIDGDMARGQIEIVAALPGTCAPEVEVFTDAAVKEVFAEPPYQLALDEALSAVGDHHEYAQAIAARLMLDETFVATTACRAYAAVRDPAAFASIVDFLRRGLGDRR
jgi:predicted ATPase